MNSKNPKDREKDGSQICDGRSTHQTHPNQHAPQQKRLGGFKQVHASVRHTNPANTFVEEPWLIGNRIRGLIVRANKRNADVRIL